MRRLGLCIAVAASACGRIAFDPVDGSAVDATPADAWQSQVVSFTDSSDVDWITEMTATADGFLVTGSSSAGFAVGGTTLVNRGTQDAFVMSLDGTGALRWVATCGGAAQDIGFAVASDVDGNVYVGGTAGAPLDCGGGLMPVTYFSSWVASFSPTSAYRWARSFSMPEALPGNPIDEVSALEVVGGHLVLAGYVHGTVDFGGGATAPIGNYDGFVAAYEPGGSFDWVHRFGGGDTFVRSIGHDAAGNLYVTGQMSNSVDFGGGPRTTAAAAAAFVVSFDATGVHRWSTLLGDAGSTNGRGVVVGPDGALHVAGAFDTQVTNGSTVTTSGMNDVFAATLALDGTPVRITRFGGPGCERVNHLEIAGGELALTGEFSNTMSFGSTSVTSQGGRDGFVAMLGTDDTPGAIWTRGAALDDSVEAVAPTPAGVLFGATRDRAVNAACNSGLIFDARHTYLEAIGP